MGESQNKAYFSINELKSDNLTDAISREWVVAAYLIGRRKRTSLFMAGIQEYGSLQRSFPEYNVSMGEPLDDFASRQNDVWIRNYTHGLALANTGSGESVNCRLDPNFDWWTV